MAWETICHEKVAARDAKIPKEWQVKPVPESQCLLDIPSTCGILTTREDAITSKYDAFELVQEISQRIFSAEEVTIAFCKRAAIAQSLVNCLTETFFDEAIERARRLDHERAAQPNKPLGPLHGLPISLKDSFKVKGHDAIIGLVCFANKPAEADSPLVSYLQSLGAVPFCKTNVPQTMMTADSHNNVFGRTLNPSNINLTAGGSTGGEGALIALRGSVLGIGTDIAGSIRIPSICNGIYGFKPSADIVPNSDQQSPVAAGIPGITPSAGPMATSIRACRFFMEALMSGGAVNFDTTCVQIPWVGQKIETNPLRIGVWSDDGIYTPTPPMRRALEESVQKLETAGVECIPIQIPGVGDMMRAIWDFYSLDGAKITCELIESSGEPLTPSVAITGLVQTPGKTMQQLFDLNTNRAIARKAVHDVWKTNKLDAVIGLPAPHTALPFDKWLAITYTCIFNYLDYPACVIPVGRVCNSDVQDGKAKYGESDQKVYSLYTGSSAYENAPIAVQLIGFRQQDERLLGTAEVVDRILNAKKEVR